MELRHLRYFLAVAEAEHITRAAESLNLSQPSLSQQIRQLEEELGAPLLERVGRRVRLTEGGRLFESYARRILALQGEAVDAVRELEGLARGTVNLGTVHTVKSYLVPKVLATFHEAHPSLFIKVQELGNPEIETALLEGSLDLGLGFGPPIHPGIDAEPLFDEKLVLVLNRRHPLAGRHHLDLATLKDLPLFLLPGTFCTRRMLDEALTRGSVKLQVMGEMGSIEGILETLRGTVAGSVLPSLALKADPQLVALPLRGGALSRKVSLLWHKGAYRSAAARALAQAFREADQASSTRRYKASY